MALKYNIHGKRLLIIIIVNCLNYSIITLLYKMDNDTKLLGTKVIGPRNTERLSQERLDMSEHSFWSMR